MSQHPHPQLTFASRTHRQKRTKRDKDVKVLPGLYRRCGPTRGTSLDWVAAGAAYFKYSRYRRFRKNFRRTGTRWATLRFMPGKFQHSHLQPAFAGGKFTMGKPEDACSDTHILNQLLQGCSASPGPIGVMLFQHSYPLPAFAGQVFWSQRTAAKQAPTLISLTSFCRCDEHRQEKLLPG